MKASKLAGALAAHVQKHGDVDVAAEYDSGAGGWLEIDDDDPVMVAEHEGRPLALINLGDSVDGKGL